MMKLKICVFCLGVLSAMTCFSQELLEVINTEANEFGLAFIDENTVCFTRKGKIMITKRRNDKWEKPTVAPFSGEYEDEYASFNYETNTLVFSSKRPRPGTNQLLSKNDIWSTKYIDGKWSSPQHLSGVFSTEGIDSGGFIIGNLTYFHSDREGQGLNDVDIYLFDSENLKKLSLSTEKVDGEVFLFDNGDAMLFMSAGHGSKGYSDIFMSIRKEGVWQKPIPIDTSGIVNTEEWDYGPVLSLDRKTLYYVRYTDGHSDIYSVDVSKLSSYQSMRKYFE